MNFKKFNDIGNSEPKAWNRSSSAGTRIVIADEEDEVPVPYCDEFDEDTEEDTEEEEEEEDPEIETETESISSAGSKKNIAKRGGKKALAIQQKQISTIILQEEFDFMQE